MALSQNYLYFSCILTHGTALRDMVINTVISINKGRNANITNSDNYRGIAWSASLGKLLDLIVLVRYSDLRRLYFDMRMVYKIIHGLIDVAFDDLFTFSRNRSTRGHVYKLYCSKSNLNVRCHFFSQRCITAWNCLSNEVVTSPSISIFNSRLHNVNLQSF